jgi:4-hydroxythreonine-4-phosphate dehydrogenase
MGDPAGIGGETILKALAKLTKKSIPVIIGDSAAFDAIAPLFKESIFSFKGLGQGSRGDAEFVDLKLLSDVQPGVTGPQTGEASYRYIMEALNLLSLGRVSAIVTCPITKKSIQAAGLPFWGHTELLADFAGTSDYVMMMAAGRLRVSLVTIHVPLREVPSLITTEKVAKCIEITDSSLKVDFGIASPCIKVCGLNPHAGEQGIMGTEERMIAEAVERTKACGINADGPFPADSLFYGRDSDAYIAMYHDQGLIPVKTVDFRRTVNITLGLPFVRTSVGHGTGLDIAGKGLADPTSLVEAYRTAESMSAFRSKKKETV